MPDYTVYNLITRCTHDEGYESRLLDLIMEDPDRIIAAHARVIKHDATTTVALLEKDGMRWVIKRYNTKNIWHALRRPFQPSRAANCWQMSKLCEQSGISVPPPVACIERRFGPLRGRSYFINEFVPAENLLAYLTGRNHPVDIEAMAKKVASLFTALRSAGIVHGDMKATNILVGDEKLFLLDLDACRQTHSQEALQRGCRKDRARFLKNWDEHPELYRRFSADLAG